MATIQVRFRLPQCNIPSGANRSAVIELPPLPAHSIFLQIQNIHSSFHTKYLKCILHNLYEKKIIDEVVQILWKLHDFKSL